ncbi:SDR family oxidoreductase [Trinickia acidisoli]|uniref:SDR family oxidoreductase n=1 Tax=Trinickia acidisoli TaxID=2767482 RepID=UPI001A8ECCCA|nr:SDR family oxidoreductase [Trinickia acidisoli]
MRVFVTGASGFVGSAVVAELIAAGHHVVGLVRSEAGAAAVEAAGAEVLRGSLEDIESLRKGTVNADGVVHTAFNHDFTRFAENCELDRRAIAAIGDALAGSERPLLVTSGLASVAKGRAATEDDAAVPHSDAYPRVSEATALSLIERGVRASVVRLPPSVHGDGDHAFVPRLIAVAREKGVAAYVGDGANHWPAVHRLDAARAYRLALERGVGGVRYHVVAEEGVRLKDIAEVIARRLNVPLVSKSPEQAMAYFGWMGAFTAMDVTATSQWTREALGWQPERVGLIEDLEKGTYFKG